MEFFSTGISTQYNYTSNLCEIWPIDHILGEIGSNQRSLRNLLVKKMKQSIRIGFQPQTHTNPVTSNPDKNNTETAESLPSTEIVEISPSTSYSLIPDNNEPLMILTKIIRSNPEFQIDPCLTEVSASKDNIFPIFASW